MATPRSGAADRNGKSRSSVEPRGEGPKRWGSLGRKGAARLSEGAIDARSTVGAGYRDERPAPNRDEAHWERVEGPSAAVRRARRNPGRAVDGDSKASDRRGRGFRDAGAGSGGAEARSELSGALGTSRGARANERLRDAAHAFERERFDEARSLLRPLAEQAPRVAAVRELLGLTYYRLGRWSDAVRELEAFRQLTNSSEQHPVLADAYRGLGRHRDVENLWDELRESSLAADLVAEGRIVMAGSYADRNDLRRAVRLLERSQRGVKRPQIHHLRQAYVLADLHERAGDVARARELFAWVAELEPNFADAAERSSLLG